jgi:hypothetical protein
MSDHNPLTLASEQGSNKKFSVFRLELSWLKHPDVLSKVEELWREPRRDQVVVTPYFLKRIEFYKYIFDYIIVCCISYRCIFFSM